MEAWIVTPHFPARARLRGKPGRCADIRYLVGIPTRTRGARSYRRMKYSESKQKREELQQQNRSPASEVHNTSMLKNNPPDNALRTASVKSGDCLILA